MIQFRVLSFENRRKISPEKGKEFADAHKLIYIETSALLNQNVDEAFSIPSKQVLDRVLARKTSLNVREPMVPMRVVGWGVRMRGSKWGTTSMESRRKMIKSV